MQSTACAQPILPSPSSSPSPLVLQFKVHVVQKLKQHMAASRVSYHGVLENDLRLQLSRFKERVTYCIEQLREDRESLRNRSQQTRAWGQSAGNLRCVVL